MPDLVRISTMGIVFFSLSSSHDLCFLFTMCDPVPQDPGQLGRNNINPLGYCFFTQTQPSVPSPAAKSHPSQRLASSLEGDDVEN